MKHNTKNLVVILSLAISSLFAQKNESHFGIESQLSISGNGLGAINTNYILIKHNAIGYGLGAAFQKSTKKFGGISGQISICLTDLIKRGEREDETEEAEVNSSEANYAVFIKPKTNNNALDPYAYSKSDRLRLSVLAYGTYLNNLPFSHKTVEKEIYCSEQNYHNSGIKLLNTMEAGAGIKLGYRITGGLFVNQSVTMGFYYHTNRNYDARLYHEKFSSTLSLQTSLCYLF